MADGVSFTWDAHEFVDMTDEIPARTRKATMYALRATGRFIVKAARAKAPVYKGSDPRAQAESGNLRKSIKNARRLESGGELFQLKVGPFGTKRQGTAVTRYKQRQHRKGFLGIGRKDVNKGTVRGVQLYRSQMEELYGYMAAGTAVGEAESKAVFEAAYVKAWAKWGAR